MQHYLRQNIETQKLLKTERNNLLHLIQNKVNKNGKNAIKAKQSENGIAKGNAQMLKAGETLN